MRQLQQAASSSHEAETRQAAPGHACRAYAAAWEFEANANATAARALMQRGLRMCKGDAPGLWHEYFRLELLYALRLRERRRVLGIMDAGGGWRPGRRGGPLWGA